MGWKEAVQVLRDFCAVNNCDTCEAKAWCEESLMDSDEPVFWAVPEGAEEWV